jgi:hypothetical protein
MEEEDKKAFLAGLKNGLGLTKSAECVLLSPKELSECLKQDAEFYQECLSAVKFSAKALLVISNTMLMEKKFDKWKQNNEYIRKFISQINLWESFCRKKDITPAKLIEAIMYYKDYDEVATSVGLTRQELNSYIFRNSLISKYIAQHPHFFN